MNNRHLLIITSDRNKLMSSISALSEANITITGLDSLNYIGSAMYKKIIIDCVSISSSLKKVSLGIRDNNETRALWDLLANVNGPEIYFLIEKIERPSSEMLQMGIQYITLVELKKLAMEAPADDWQPSQANANERSGQSILTADDIRDLHQQGIHQLPAGSKLTSWAAEVADALNFHTDSHKLYLLFPVKVASSRALQEMRSELFELGSKFANMLFVVNPLFLPIFSESFPSLQSRTVATSVHWASHGAFTGETSVEMLTDQRCFGAIIPTNKPYTDPKNLAALQQLACKQGLTLFSTFTLASSGTCDIIASDKSQSGAIIPLYPAETLTSGVLPVSGAVIVNSNFLKQSAFRKGN